MEKNKRIFLIIFLGGILFSLFPFFALAAADTETQFPDLPDVQAPKTTKTLLPEYVRYLFELSVLIAGLIAFAGFVYGGFRYIASVGSPAAMKDARDQITSSLLGLVLILASFLLLNTINPQLTILKTGNVSFQRGVILYADANACDAQKDKPEEGTRGDGEPFEEGVDYDYYRASSSKLNFAPRAIYFFSGNEDVDVYLYKAESYGNEPTIFNYASKNECIPLDSVTEYKSIYLRWKIPGVYLCNEALQEKNGEWVCEKEERIYVGDTADVGDFDNKVLGMKIINKYDCAVGESKCTTYCHFAESADCFNSCMSNCQTAEDCEKPFCQMPIVTYGVVLHEDKDFKHDAQVFLKDLDIGGQVGKVLAEERNWCWPHRYTGGPFCVPGDENNIVRAGEGVSSITIFPRPNCYMGGCEATPGEGVTLYADFEFNEEDGGQQFDDCGDKEFGDEHGCRCGPIKSDSSLPVWLGKNENGDFQAPASMMEDCKVMLGEIGENGSTWERRYPRASSIKIDGNYIVVLFREDGRGEVFRRSDVRLKDNHIGNDKVINMLVIPCGAKSGCSIY